MGVGNLLMSDDGLGVHAVRELARHPPGQACLVDAGTDYLSALPYLESARRVLILDAVQGPGAPGSIYQFSETEVEHRPGNSHAHVSSVLETRRLLPPGAKWPDITILGMQPATLDYGMTLSAPVARALPGLLALARHTLLNWQASPFENDPLQVNA